jgi:citrate synthase
MSKDLQSKFGGNLYDLSYEIEQTVLEQKNLKPNVDFYAASVYSMLNLDSSLFTPLFACSRVSGWCAQILEQLEDNRLIRPRAEYVGSPPRSYVESNSR